MGNVPILLMVLMAFFNCKELAMAQAQQSKDIRLPRPVEQGEMSVEKAILKRRSIRNFSSKDLSWQAISNLLWAAQGITDARQGLRAAPSAGALYPAEIYLLSKDGLYHYLPAEHKLETMIGKDLRKNLQEAALGQPWVGQAPIDIVICMVYERITGRYGQRGRKYADIEVGHIAQNIHLQAVALGLGSVPLGAFSDEEVKNALGLADDCEPVYIIPVGYPR